MDKRTRAYKELVKHVESTNQIADAIKDFMQQEDNAKKVLEARRNGTTPTIALKPILPQANAVYVQDNSSVTNMQQNQQFNINFQFSKIDKFAEHRGKITQRPIQSPSIKHILNLIVEKVKVLQPYPKMYDYEFVKWRADVIVDLHKQLYCNDNIPENHSMSILRKGLKSGVEQVKLQFVDKNGKWVKIEEAHHERFFQQLYDLMGHIVNHCIRITCEWHDKEILYINHMNYAKENIAGEMNATREKYSKIIEKDLEQFCNPVNALEEFNSALDATFDNIDYSRALRKSDVNLQKLDLERRDFTSLPFDKSLPLIAYRNEEI